MRKISVFVICVEAIISLLLHNLYDCTFNLKQTFQKNKVVTGKTPSFVIGPLGSHHCICLNIDF